MKINFTILNAFEKENYLKNNVVLKFTSYNLKKFFAFLKF